MPYVKASPGKPLMTTRSTARRLLLTPVPPVGALRRPVRPGAARTAAKGPHREHGHGWLGPRRNCQALLQRSRETGGDGLRGYFAGSY